MQIMPLLPYSLAIPFPGKYTLRMNGEEPENKADSAPDGERIEWHPAFFEAIKMELEEYGDKLSFISEYQLTAQPLRIDVVIVKKTGDVPVKKNIAAIFRQINILEYKSPDDYVSVKDFYLVYGYACLYMALNGTDVNEMTLTFMQSGRPRELFAHLQEKRGFTIEEKSAGIYTVTGDILPIQVIDTQRLSPEENLWLRDLDNRLDAAETRRITTEIYKLEKVVQIGAYLDAVMRANAKSFKEAMEMSDTAITFDQLMEDVGLAAKWRDRGEEKKAREIAIKLLGNGISLEQTAQLCGLDIADVRKLSENN